ncbi:unnamed protein product [Eruca vesicaria subsp. sativa]|uniref:Disease resistance R13L4/SHOC-2-like LRR domain-containing protein n=1 Tax=Eruca vesicaria subsp. sativa TaxID=29727 RepID=A0ABC8LVG6_ERUVS|nr:unnamed protein product [Eruca vesicaria subsp. sativa]
MPSSNLEKLWEGSRRIRNLKRMYLRDSKNLKEVPNLSTATNLWKLDLSGCSSLVKLPSSIGYATNLNELFLSRCSSLVELPFSIGNATNLKKLNLSDCSSLVELPFSIGNATDLTELDLRDCTSLVELPSSIGNLHKLSSFILKGCSKIEAVPVNINMEYLRILDLADCSSLKTFPEICANIRRLSLNGTGIEDIPSSIKLWSRDLYHFAVSYSERLVSSPRAFDVITELHVCDQRIQELAPWIKGMSRLRKLIISGCTKIVSLMQLLPDSLETLEAKNCESLERLDSSFLNKNLHKLDLSGCSSLVELPSSIGNATNLKELKLSKCSSLLELPSSIGNLQKLQRLTLKGCEKLESIPVNINMESLKELDLADCSSLKTFPEISTNVERLKLKGTKIEDIPLSIRSWTHLHHLSMPYSESLRKSLNTFDLITVLCLCDKRIQELSPCIKKMSRLRKLVISGCTKLVSLPQLPESLRYLKAENCESLERVDSSCCFQNVGANFGNCFKLNQEARELIVRSCRFAVLPGEKIPTYFLWQATGSSLSTKWNVTDHHIPVMGLKACVLVVNKGDAEVGERKELDVYYCIKDGSTSVRHRSGIHSQRFPILNEHLYIFKMEEKVSCKESSVFEFEVRDEKWEVRECALNLVPQL